MCFLRPCVSFYWHWWKLVWWPQMCGPYSGEAYSEPSRISGLSKKCQIYGVNHAAFPHNTSLVHFLPTPHEPGQTHSFRWNTLWDFLFFTSFSGIQKDNVSSPNGAPNCALCKRVLQCCTMTFYNDLSNKVQLRAAVNLYFSTLL